MESININGEEYVRKSDIRECELAESWEHVCVIATNGWIFEGYRSAETGEGGIALADAHVVRKWTNGLGIGGLADPAHKDDYTLDEIGRIDINSAIATIKLRW
jgi:hypothetical protein